VLQVVVEGVYHADPHQGNVLLTEDRRLALLDFGLLGRIDEDTRSGLSLLLLAIAQNRAHDVADLIISLSLTGVDADQSGFVHYPDLRVMPTWVSEHVARGVMRRSGRHNPGRSRPHALG
jgi:predicted unusual protein kinase regulating ubiquinone biosynthesis (AarF/ABC1/UbiB family)